jgi:hypothetical protein
MSRNAESRTVERVHKRSDLMTDTLEATKPDLGAVKQRT